MNKKLLNIIPMPKKVELKGGENYETYVVAPTVSFAPRFTKFIDAFKLNVSKIHGITLIDGDGGIVLELDPSLNGEAYKIVCTEKGIVASAGTEDGIGNALATLFQMIENKDGKILVPAYTIEDCPDSPYRALMIDLPGYNTFEQICHFVDVCHLYKIKYIHFHFADNGGYCLPSKKFPKLPTKDHSFSFEQVEALRKYCTERNVEIIPEIDVPGHATYLNVAYPELFSDTPIEGEARADLMCIGKEGVFDSIREIFSEVIDMFPESRYFHIGGDEAIIEAWNNCVDCKAYMEKNDIPNVKALYTHSIKLLTDMVIDLGRTPIVWEGFPREGAEQISRKVIVTAWESLYHLPNELLEEGFTVTNSSWMPLYIVHPNSSHAKLVPGWRWYPKDILCDWNLYTWKNWWDQSYAYEKPIVVEPTDKVIGATFCAWLIEYEYSLLGVRENLPAMCERIWNVNSTFDINDFEESLKKLIDISEKM